MLYYLLTIAFLISFFVFQYFNFRKVYYTHKSLCQFKELRHDSMIFLIDNLRSEMPLVELGKHQTFLHRVDIMIKYYDEIKYSIYHSISIKAIYTTLNYALQQYKRIVDENNDIESMQVFNNGYHAGIKTFLKTMPFYKQRFLLSLTIVFFTFLVKIGFRKCAGLLMKMKKLYKIETDINNQCFN